MCGDGSCFCSLANLKLRHDDSLYVELMKLHQCTRAVRDLCGLHQTTHLHIYEVLTFPQYESVTL